MKGRIATSPMARRLAMVLLCLMPWLVSAAVVVAPGTASIDLAGEVDVLAGAPPELGVTQLGEPTWAGRFVRPSVRGSALNLGRASGVVWLRVNLAVQPQVQSRWVLDVPYGDLRGLQWFVVGPVGSGPRPARELAQARAGFLDYRYHAQPITLAPGPMTLYARIPAQGALTLPLQLQTEATFLGQEAHHLFLQALYFGALTALLVYALLFAWSVKDLTYLIFSAYLLATGAAIFVGNGFARLYVWPPGLIFDAVVQSSLFALAGALSLWLTGRFLQGTRLAGWLQQVLRWLALAYLLVALGFIAASGSAFATVLLDTGLLILTLITAPVAIAALVIAHRHGQGEGLFGLAWAMVWLGGLLATLRAFDTLPSTPVTLYAMQIFTGVAAVLFSLALFVRVRQHDQARVLAQQAVLDARQTLIQTLQDSERKLEATVDERTAALQASLAAEKRLREQYVRFGAMISHEFRNPLGVIETQTSLLGRELKAGIDNAERRIGTVRSAAQRLAMLFEKWLQSDRLQNATDKLQTQVIDFDSWLEDLVSKCHAYHPNHRIECELDGPVGLLNADERLLQIALLNLIDNACKYSPAQTTVLVTASREGDKLCLDVTDRGVGIPGALQGRVFDEYFRVDPDSPVPGVGLGLPFVKKIITLHGGQVSALDNPDGQGVRFRIRLPLRGPY